LDSHIQNLEFGHFYLNGAALRSWFVFLAWDYISSGCGCWRSVDAELRSGEQTNSVTLFSQVSFFLIFFV